MSTLPAGKDLSAEPAKTTTGASLFAPRAIEPPQWSVLLYATLLAVITAILAPASAQAGPYSLCVNLADSSGQPAGTQEFGCDPASVSRTLSSSTFGSYEGAARASSDAFDRVRLYASAQFTDYLPGSYVFSPSSGGIDFAASAWANFTDLVAISGPSDPAVLRATFGVTGTLTQAGVSAQLCYGFAFGGPITGGVCVVGLPPVITVESTSFQPDGTPRPLNFQFMAVVFNSDESNTNPYSASGTTDLEQTILLQELLVTSPNGTPIPGITLAGSFDYPLSPLNQVTPAFLPQTGGLLLAGLGLLVMMTRRRKIR